MTTFIERHRTALGLIDPKVAQAPNGGYGANRYRPEEFGITPDRERERAAAYVERFGVAS